MILGTFCSVVRSTEKWLLEFGSRYHAYHYLYVQLYVQYYVKSSPLIVGIQMFGPLNPKSGLNLIRELMYPVSGLSVLHGTKKEMVSTCSHALPVERCTTSTYVGMHAISSRSRMQVKRIPCESVPGDRRSHCICIGTPHLSPVS